MNRYGITLGKPPVPEQETDLEIKLKAVKFLGIKMNYTDAGNYSINTAVCHAKPVIVSQVIKFNIILDFQSVTLSGTFEHITEIIKDVWKVYRPLKGRVNSEFGNMITRDWGHDLNIDALDEMDIKNGTEWARKHILDGFHLEDPFTVNDYVAACLAETLICDYLEDQQSRENRWSKPVEPYRWDQVPSGDGGL
jgi:hypothetical protein